MLTVRTRDEVLPLTGMRALLAWWVVAFHFLRNAVPDEQRILHALLEPGHLAVDVFFVLSGYVLARRYAAASVGRPPWRRAFWVRRLARIYPLYVVSLLVGFAASWPAVALDPTTWRGRIRLVLDALLLNAWSHTAMFRYNWAAWSLSVEAFFYALLPFTLPRLALLPRRSLARLLVVCCAATFVAPAAYALSDPDHLHRLPVMGDEVMFVWYLKFFPLQRLPELVAGAALALWLPRGHAWTRPAWIPAAIFVVVAVSGVVPYAYVHSGVLLPLVLAMIAGVAGTQGGWLASRPLVALGHASYATYILHVPLFQLLARWDPEIWEKPVHVLAYMALLVLVSLCMFRWVEEPARRWLTGRLTSGNAL